MTATFDGLPVALLARRWSVPQVRALRTTPSCMDTVHALGAEGAPAGTVVVAEEQTAGRGRDGRTWHSPLGGAWLALLLRPSEAAVGVLSIRAGLVVADAIDELLGVARTRVKWPNDVLLEDRKVAGVLCESRWQGDALQWLALGIGVNVCNAIAPDLASRAATLRDFLPHVRRIDVLDRLVAGAAAVTRGGVSLSEAECLAFAERDWLCGRALAAPAPGRAGGIRPNGALLIEAAAVTEALDGHVELA